MSENSEKTNSNVQSRVKITHITTVHKWNDNRIFEKQCSSLAEMGFEVHLIAPNVSITNKNNVHLHSLNLNFKSRTKRVFKAPKIAFKKAMEIDTDVYHLHDPELLRIALKLKNKGKKVVYDSHEDVPKQIFKKKWLGFKWVRSFISFVYNQYEKSVTSKINGVVSVIDEITNQFNNKNKITVKNFPITSAIIEAVQQVPSSEKWIAYVGGLTISRGVKDYINAMENIDGYKLVLVGKFDSDELLNECEKLPGWKKVEFKGHMDMAGVIGVLARSQFGLCVLHTDVNYLTSLPTKGFEYMAAQLPMIMSDFEYWRPYFEGCAKFVEPSKPELISKAINNLIEDQNEYERLKSNCISKAPQFSWHSQAEKLSSFYNKL